MDEEAIPARAFSPGRLRLVEAFLNVSDVEPTADDLVVAASIRRRYAQGESLATLAKAFGLGQTFVSAVAGGRLWAASGEERYGGLGSADEARAWLTRQGLWSSDDVLSDGDVGRLRELKRLLRALACANNGEPLDVAVPRELDRLADRSALLPRFSHDDGPRLVPGVGGVDGVIGALLAVVIEGIHAGTWTRLKACRGTGCPDVFYDYSPAESRTWCHMSVCGNRAKVRKYQERRRGAGAPQGSA